MTEKEVLQMIQKDFDNFWNRRFDYPSGLPFEFVSKFRHLILNIPYLNHEGKPSWQPKLAKKIIAKADEDLTYGEVGTIINIILGSPQAFHFDDPNEAIDYVMELMEVKNYYNEKVALLNQQLGEKQRRMMEQAGLTKAINFNGKN